MAHLLTTRKNDCMQKSFFVKQWDVNVLLIRYKKTYVTTTYNVSNDTLFDCQTKLNRKLRRKKLLRIICRFFGQYCLSFYPEHDGYWRFSSAAFRMGIEKSNKRKFSVQASEDYYLIIDSFKLLAFTMYPST